MPSDNHSKPPAAWLDHLYQAGHWQRLIEMGSRSLEVDPMDSHTHRHMAWAYAKLGNPRAMRRHVEFLLGAAPEEARNHHLAAVYHLEVKQLQKARRHVETFLAREPQNPNAHYIAAVYSLLSGRIKEARHHVREARSISPQWPAAAHLEIEIDGVTKKRASDAWERIDRTKKALALDPRNAAMLTSIGTILLVELEEPRQAEIFVREALSIEPNNRDRQRLLLQTIRARSLLYRTLSLPISAVRSSRTQHWSGARLILLVVAFKAVLLFFAWLVAAGLLFAPAAKVYEWLVLTEVSGTRRLPRFLAPLGVALRWPFWVRLCLCLSIIVGGWVLFFWLAFRFRPLVTLQIMAGAFAIHFGLVSLLVGLRKLRSRLGLWRNRRRQRKAGQRRLVETVADAT